MWAHDESGCAWASTKWEDGAGDGLVYPVLIDVSKDTALAKLREIDSKYGYTCNYDGLLLTKKKKVIKKKVARKKQRAWFMAGFKCEKCGNKKRVDALSGDISCSYVKCSDFEE